MAKCSENKKKVHKFIVFLTKKIEKMLEIWHNRRYKDVVFCQAENGERVLWETAEEVHAFMRIIY